MKQSLKWAGRSGEDRYLGMVEASGSIPDRSTYKLLIVLINTLFYTISCCIKSDFKDLRGCLKIQIVPTNW